MKTGGAIARTLFLLALGLLAAWALPGRIDLVSAQSQAGPIPEINIDVEDDAAPANAPLTVGSIETCRRIDNNDLLDAEEDTADVIQVDVVADGGGVPAFNDNGTPANPGDDFGALFGFGLDFNFDSAKLQANAVDQRLLSVVNSGSNPFVVSSGGPFPNTTGTSSLSQIETGLPLSATAESGEGVLARYDVEGIGAGLAALSLSNVGILDAANAIYTIASVNSAPGSETTVIAVDQACPSPGGESDLEVNSVAVDGPQSAQVDSAFNVAVTATLHNNGEAGPTTTDTTIDIAIPNDCTRNPDGAQAIQDTVLDVSLAGTAQATWSVTCSQPSAHQIAGSANVAVDEPDVSDPNDGNNGGQSQDTTEVLGAADIKVQAMTTDVPPTAQAGADFDVTVTAILHDNGPASPAIADTTLDLTVPPDCVRSPDSSQDTNGQLLAQGVPVQVARTWTVSCSQSGAHTFDGQVTLALNQPHVSDPDMSNNCDQAQGAADIDEPPAGNDVAVEKSDDLHPHVPADLPTMLPITITITNGQVPSHVSVLVSLVGPHTCDPLLVPEFGDANTTPDILTGPSTAANLQTTRLDWTELTMAANEVRQTVRNYQVTCPLGGPYNLELAVEAFSDTADPNGNNNRDQNEPRVISTDDDFDDDTIVNSADNCPYDSNSDQLDTDGDREGDACDTDDDNDGFPDSADACPAAPEDYDTQDDDDGCPDTDTSIMFVVTDSAYDADVSADANNQVRVSIRNSGNVVGDIDIVLLLRSALGQCEARWNPIPGDTYIEDPINGTLLSEIDLTLLNMLPGEIREITRTYTAHCFQISFHDNAVRLEVGAAPAYPLAEDSDKVDDNVRKKDIDITVFGEADIKKLHMNTTEAATLVAGQDGTITIRSTLHNNGPDGSVLALDDLIVVSKPPDCSITPESYLDQPVELPVSSQVFFDRAFTVNCTSPSFHTFQFRNTVSPDSTHMIDPNLGNNSVVLTVEIPVTAHADLKATSVTVTAPDEQPLGDPMTVSVQASFHNNGPSGPVNADTSLDLNLPPDCTKEPEDIQREVDLTLPTSSPVQITKSWSVTCTQPSSHTFLGNASIELTDDIHVADPHLDNNSGQGQSTTTVTAQADLKVVSASLQAPATVNVDTPFTVTVETTLHNNGPDDDITTIPVLEMSVPPDCTAIPTSEAEPVALPTSANMTVQRSWTVTCSQASSHILLASITVPAESDVHLIDPDTQNNSAQSQSTTTVTADADLKVASVSLELPGPTGTGVPFDVTVRATLHNNGPYGPTSAEATLDLSVPTDCIREPENAQTEDDLALPTSSPTQITKSWSVRCTDPSNHTFSASSTVTLDQLHVADNNNQNDSTATQATIPVFTVADLKATSVTVTAPDEQPLGDPMTVSVQASFHNNGPSGPVNADTSLDLNLPPDCAKEPEDIQREVDLTLPTSSPVQITKSWSVTCTQPSSHTFLGNASIELTDDIHVADPHLDNNSGQGQSTTTVTAQADLKVVSASLQAPATVNVDTPFTVTVETTLHNNGPFEPDGIDFSVDLLTPSDCEVSPAQAENQLDFPPSTAMPDLRQSWEVTCSATSNHTLSARVSVSTSQEHVIEIDDANNSAEVQVLTTVMGEADPKLVSLTTPDDLPEVPGKQILVTAGAPTQPPFTEEPIPARTRTFRTTETLHNNGPHGPVGVGVTINVDDDPEDPCDVRPDSHSANLSLPASNAVEHGEDWTASWTHQQFEKPPFYCDVTFSKTVTLGMQHMTETNAANNDVQLLVTFVRDADGDTVPDNFEDMIDNCQDVPNPGQTDSDKDGTGDACDAQPTPVAKPVVSAPTPTPTEPGSLPLTGSEPPLRSLLVIPWVAVFLGVALPAMGAVLLTLFRSTKGRMK